LHGDGAAMTPAARIAAAIEILDRYLAGAPVEQVLTTWARGNRFAGSGDRAAIRDHVFDALRCRRSFAALGGGETGRGLMIGAVRAAGGSPEDLFTGKGHAPPPLSVDEKAEAPAYPDLGGTVALDCPDWLAAPLRESLGPDFERVMQALRHRAPLFLRVNLRKTDPVAAQAALRREGIETRPHPGARTALEVTSGPRKVARSEAFAQGLVEVQDVASQAVIDMLPLKPGQTVLDLCAGGGGKTLAMAGRAEARFFAHDAAGERMRDLPARAARAGVAVTILTDTAPDHAGPFDLVLCDVPCSGSGAWRRQPEGKWRLTPQMLADLLKTQAGILDRAAPLVRPGGTLAYVTCSLLKAENGAQVDGFLSRHPGWQIAVRRQLVPGDGGDGFFVAVLTRD